MEAFDEMDILTISRYVWCPTSGSWCVKYKKKYFACAEIGFSFIAITIFPLDFPFVLLS